MGTVIPLGPRLMSQREDINLRTSEVFPPPESAARFPAPLPGPDWAAIDAYAAEAGLWDPADIWSLSAEVCRERGIAYRRRQFRPRLRVVK